jgi:tetratricopeptide (TPR) repeat protein
MPLKFIAVCIACLFAASCIAQQRKIDSLRLALKSQPKEDTFRLNTLIALIRASSPSDFEGGMMVADEAIALSQKIGDDSKLGIAYVNKGILYHDKAEYENFIGQLELALKSFRKANHLSGQARTYWLMNIGFFSMGKYDRAIEEARKSVDLYRQTGETIKQANSLNSIGGNYQQLGDLAKAIQYYLLALAIYEEKKDLAGLTVAYLNVGLVNKQLTRYAKAIESYEKGLLISRQLNDKVNEAKTLNMIGSAYDEWGNSHKALEYYRQAFEINKKENNTWGIASDYSNMGIAHLDMNDYDSALTYLRLGLPMMRERNDVRNEASILIYLGLSVAKAPDNILLKHGFNPATKLQTAEGYLQKAMEVKTEIEDLKGQVVCLEGLADVYKLQKKYPEAIAAQEKLIRVKDSIFSDEKTIAIARSEMQFEQDKKDAVTEAEHAAEIRQQKTTRNFLLAGAGLVLIVSGLLFISYKRRSDAVAKKNDAELKAQITDTELKVMRLQMNPHFIFNSLNSISDYITKNNPREADDYLSKFAKVMRMTLENSEQQAIPLADDLKALELYMQLEAKRLNNKFIYQINVSDDIDKENTLVPPMIFQPFVENSIWHGISKKEGQGHILIDIRKEGEMLSCRIDDDGVGRKQAGTMKAQGEEKKQSLGMRITKARIDILNKLKGSNATVQLVDKPQGVTAELKLPVETNF